MDFFYLKVRFSKGKAISKNNDRILSQDVLLPKNLLIKDSMKPYKDALQTGSCIIEVNPYHEGTLTTSSSMNASQYYIWLGKCTDLADTIELPFPNIYANDEQLPENDIAQIRFLMNLPYAKDVILVPKTEFDWDIIQNHAVFIENNLLRSLSVVELGRDLNIPITSSITAKVLIKDILLIDNSKPHSPKRFLARINNASQLLIEPFQKKDQQQEKDSSNLLTKPANLSKTEEENSKLSNYNKDWLKDLDFTVFSFRVLPLSYRHQQDPDSLDSHPDPRKQSKSLDHADIYSSYPTNSDTLEEFIKDDDFLNSFLDPPPTQAQLSSSSSSSRPQQQPNSYVFPWEKQDQDLYLDESFPHYNNVFIHPFHLKFLLERQCNSSSSHPTMSKSDFAKYFQELSYPFIGILSIDNGKISPNAKTSNSQLLSEQVYCRVLLTKQVRPFMISIPSQMMNVLQITSYQSVKLNILFNTPRLLVPSSISLHPIYWQDPSSSIKKEEKKPEENLDVNVIIQAFLRFIETHSRPSFPFLLSHQSILSLDIPSSSSSKTIDFLVSFQFRKSKKENNNDNNNSSCPSYLPLSLENPAAEDFLSRIMSSLQLQMNLPFHPEFQVNISIDPKPSNLAEQQQLNPYYLTKNMSRILSTLMDEIALNFISSGILQQFSRDSHRYVFHNDYSYLICGESDAGKTTFLKQFLIPEIQRQNFKFQSFIKSIDMKEILIPLQIGLPSALEKIVSSLKDLFQEIRNLSPSILIIDNIDLLCSSLHSSFSSAETHQTGILRDEKLLILSTYFYRFLEEYSQSRKEKHYQIYHSIEEHHSNPENEEEITLNERIVANYSQGNLFLIATCNSLQSLDTYLLTSSFGFSKYLSLSSTIPRKDERWDLLLHLLRSHQMPLEDRICQDEKELSNLEEKRDEILQRMENYSFQDYQNILKLIQFEVCYQLILQQDISTEMKQLSTTIENILQATKRYQTLSSQPTALQFLQLPNHQTSSTLTTTTGTTTTAVGPSKSSLFQRLIFQSYFLLKPFQKMLETFHYPILYSKLYQGIQNTTTATSEIRFPRSMMLFGAPGCGKTFLANAMGQFFESFGKVFMIKGPQLLNKYIGESEKSIRSLFELSLSFGCPVLLFFDEFESLAPKRGKDNTGITDRIVNQLLTFLDGVESTLSQGRKKVVANQSARDTLRDLDADDEDDDDDAAAPKGQIFLLIASSRPDLIDPALLRPGRIERHVYLGNPKTSREYSDLLRAMLSPYAPTSSSLSVENSLNKRSCSSWNEEIQKICEQPKMKEMTMADLQAIVDTAYLKAVHVAVDNPIEAEKDANSSNVTISPTTLREAFEETKPSLSESDRRFYDNISNSFLRQQKKTNGNDIKSNQESNGIDIDRLQKLSFH